VHHNGDRDELIDRALRSTLGTAGVPVTSGTCVDAEIVAAWSEGALAPAEAARVEVHLSQCGRCQALFGVFARSVPAPMAPESLWRRWRLQWLVPIAATATALAVWVAVPRDEGSKTAPESDAQLARVDERPTAVESTPLVGTPPVGDSAPPADARGDDQRDRSASADSLEVAARSARAAAQAPLSTPVEPSRQAASADAPGVVGGRLAERESRADTDVANRVPPAAPVSREAAQVREEAPVGTARLAEKAALEDAARPAAAPVPAPVETRATPRGVGALARANGPVEIASPDGADRWRIATGGRVERAMSGADRWEAVVVVSPVPVTAGASPAPRVCWLVGPAGAVRLTTDGSRFERVPFPAAVDLVGVRATSAASAVVRSADGREWRTDDRGVSWSPLAP
jgi:hypothetical protein